MAKLIVKDLCKGFQFQNAQHIVLDKLNFEAELEEITVLLGKSGCGKTTLLRLLCGLEQVDSGEIFYPQELRIGMMFQEARLMPWLTCEENIVLGLPKNYDKEYIASLLHTVGLSNFARAYPIQLSGGMQQRTALARTLAQKSQFVLMDEPFAALDYFTRLQMQQEVVRVNKTMGTGIIFVTHNIDEALAIGDKVLVMCEGSISREIRLPKTEARDILQEPYISYKKQILTAILGNNL